MILESFACLTMAVYFEARGEPLAGQYAVAQAVMERVEDPDFPDTVCGVVKENRTGKKHQCQFSFYCDGKPEEYSDTEALKKAAAVSMDVLTGARMPQLEGVTFFHTKNVNPSWADHFEKVHVIGNHIFYKKD